MRKVSLIVLGLLAGAGAWLFWPHAGPQTAGRGVSIANGSTAAAAKNSAAKAAAKPSIAALNTNKLAFRLSNTTNSLRRLEAMPHAILLANAFIDTDKPLDLKMPANLKAAGDPGAYIVQARGAVNAPFRAALAQAGAQIVSYIPNNAYLVRVTAGEAGALAGSPLVQAVLPYEPYYKLQSSLLGLAVGGQTLPPGTALNLGLFAADAATTEQQIENLGAKIIGRDQSAFGPVLRVLAPADWTQLAQVPGVQILEPSHARVLANDLARVTAGISPDTTSGMTNDYLGLNGKNVLVAVNDSGVDDTHPDFSATGTAGSGASGPTRVFGLNPIDLVDTDGHGTHIAGIIAGNGAESYTLNNPPDSEPEGSVTNADFRGKAPLASLFSLNDGGYSDYQLQTNAALVGALISNNSWDYGNGASEYDLAAASYDAATRDAVPYQTGSQPVLFVFAAGNVNPGGDNSGQGGSGDTILSPGTAKNVITVGALEQPRYITNIVTLSITPAVGTNAPTTNSVAYWQTWTDSGDQVAWYSARGNVGIGTEGNYGRFKPDVVSPGTFVVSTRSKQWNTNAYYNPTNVQTTPYLGQVMDTNGLLYYNVNVPSDAVGVTITISSNRLSPVPFPLNLPIYVRQVGIPTTNSGGYDFVTTKDGVAIPPDNGGNIPNIQAIQGNGFNFAVGNSTNFAVNYDLTVSIFTTNDLGDYYQVLEGMNETLAPWYRYESGTSMAAADVSGVLALIQDYFTNQFQPSLTPSPALLKALLINGSRSVANYPLALTNSINIQGWGLDNIQDCVPSGGLVNQFNTPGSSFFVEQNPTNALATGDSHTYILNVDTNSAAQYYGLQATLVWTDPPGDPAAAIKLVNNLDLVITNLDTGDVNYGSVYFGNDISPDLGYNEPWDTNNPPNLDTINNVENILLPAFSVAAKYSITVVGRSVNVNAVTAQTNNAAGQYAPNIVQDFALVVSIGEGEVTNAFTVTDGGIASNPTGDQNITVVVTTNSPLMNQFVGASSPLLGTNTLPLGTNTVWGPNGVVTIGQTNQWHFYIVTNTGPAADYTNAAFITFDAVTLSIPRMGVLEEADPANATKPEADIDLYVSQDPSITNLSPVAISNCLAGVSGFGVKDGGASLGQGGTEFVFFTNSAPGQVYYVGVKSEDQMGSEYAFMPIFTDIPFSSLDQNGNQIVRGLLLPMNIPDGTPAHPGVTNVFALAVIPMVVEKVTVTNLNEHQNFGDLFGALSFSRQSVVLNNHDGFGNTYGAAPIVYDDSRNRVPGTTNTDGPGSLVNFRTKSALGPWILGEMDNSAGDTGRVSVLTLLIQPHRDLRFPGVIVSVPPGGWFVDYVDVPPGYTNLTFYATNLPPTIKPQPLEMYEKLGNDPTSTDYDQMELLTNCAAGTYPTGLDPGNSISIGPPLAQGQYFIGIYNPDSTVTAQVYISATLGINASENDIFNYTAGSETVLPDDAVSGSVIPIPNTVTQLVSSVNVGLVINSPRISDYTFTLVSPNGQRVLLMENRGDGTTNGAGSVFTYTNVLNATATGGPEANTNYLAVDPAGGTVPIIYNFYTAVDQMTVYDTTNASAFSTNGPDLLLNTGFTNNPPNGGGGPESTTPVTVNVNYPVGVSAITIIMNQFGNPAAPGDDAWTYTAGAPITNYQYLVFTDNTNLATDPIKFAEPPFNFTAAATNYFLSDLDLATNGDYLAPTNIYDAYGGWTVPTNLVTYPTIITNGQLVLVTNVVLLTNNLVSVITDPSSSLTGDAGGSNLLALANGTITRSIATIPGHIYNVTFWYRGPGIAAWWRGEGNATDSSDPENNNNNGTLIGRFNFPAGEVGQAFQFEDPGNTYQFAGTNTYVQVPASPSLNVGAGGGFTVEGWINPTNLARPQPLVEWLAHVPTDPAVTNIVIVQGPVLNPATGHYYYLLDATNWTTSELWADQLGGHLATINTANEENWVYDTFTAYGTLNRNLWIGLTNNPANATFSWSSGLTNVLYANWLSTQPTNCDGSHEYTAILGPTNSSPTNALPGLWVLADNNGFICNSPATNRIYGVVEVSDIPANGVQFWISGTNWTPGESNVLQGCLYANIVDTNYVSHEIFSAAGLLSTNVYQHVALTYNTNSGIAALYLNGADVVTTNLGVFVPKTDGDLLLGWDMSHYTNNFYGGQMDEMSLYSRALSHAEINAIYNVSASTTNRLIGKFDPTVTPAVGLAEALVAFGPNTNVIYGVNNQWSVNSFTFTATSNSMPLTISGIEPGILLDSFAVNEAPEANLYYLPEQALESLAGNPAAGNWTLQVWDNRAGAYVTNVAQLVNWQLSFVLESNAVVSASLPPQTPVTTTVSSGQIVYYSVTVPEWAHFATNILVSSSQPVDLLFFNTNNFPGNSNGPNATLLANSTSGVGSPVMAVNPAATQLQLQPGATYYLGVQNNGIHAASVTLEVDYDLLNLTNGVPFTGVLNTNEYNSVRYFEFDVSSNASEATFQLLQLSGNADLVVQKGAPLPTLTSSDYGSFNVGNSDEDIYVLTNSSPVALSAGRWYLGVFKRDSGLINYSVLAKELDPTNGMPAIIDLADGVPFNFTAGPGAALTNFFRFSAANFTSGGVTNNLGVRFELYNLSGNGDLTVQTNAPPLSTPFFQSSQNGGRSPELILIYTNSALTNLATDWYLGVPNREVTGISYTIVAAINTNGYFPAFPGASGAGGGAAGGSGPVTIGGHGTNGTVYHVISTGDSGLGTLRDAVSSTNRTVVFDISGTINLSSPLVITNSYLTIAGQTAPGDGITVAGYVTKFQTAHDVIIRDVRFRSGNQFDSFGFLNASNVIADHISAAWSANNLVSVLNSSNVTVQWSIMADSLYSTNPLSQSTGSFLREGGGTLSFHHNLYADNYSGSPRLGDNLTLDFVNNVIYNWGIRSGLTGGTNDLFDYSTNGCTNQLNYVCNYLIAGPDTAIFATNNYGITNIAFFGGVTNALAANWIFQTNNFMDGDTNGVLNGSDTSWGMFTNQYTPFSRAFPTPPVPVNEAFIAYERVLDFAGVNLTQRDPVDADIVSKVRTQTGRLIATPGASPLLNSTAPYLDTDQDGIPDFWEVTFGQDPTNASNNQLSMNANFIGYTDLEEYLDWLAGPHALTITNTPVSVDLMQLFGKTGNLSFSLTNAVNGTVYLTNVLGSVTYTGALSNRIAVFTPTSSAAGGTNYYGYASFGVEVTNTDTVAYFGPVTVSVVVSAVPITYASITNTPQNTPPVLATIPPQTIDELMPLTVTNTATDTNLNVTLSYNVILTIDTNAMNAKGWPLTYVTTIPSPVISSNGIITWTPSEAQGPGVYIITTIVTDNGVPPASATNSFSVTVNEVNTAPFWPLNPTNYTLIALSTLVVTNTASDADIPPNPLTYQLFGPAGAVIDTNGIITWTPSVSQAGGVYTFMTIVTDTNPPAVNATSLSATNVFTVTVPIAFAPYAFTQPAQAVTGSTAQLNGMATPNGLPTTAWFEWGTTTNYGNVTPAVNVGSAFNVVYTQSTIYGLELNVLYHSRLVVSNGAATTYGFDQLLDEANVVVWGANAKGQAVVPPGLNNVVAIDGAYGHSLAMRDNVTAVGWGENGLGQATVPANLNNLLAIAGGEFYSMVLRNDNTVAEWGDQRTPAGLSNIVEIAGGTFARLALKNDGSVLAWGANFSRLTNVPPGLNNAVAIAGGLYHSLAVKNNGTVAAWGNNSVGQLNVPAGLTNVVGIAGGAYHSLALKYDGTVAAWGDDSAGQTDVPAGLNNVVAIAAGGFNSMALRSDGRIVTWGTNDAGQCSVPVSLTNAVAISSGFAHSLALTPQSNASLTSPVVLNLTNGVEQTNTVVPGGMTYYLINVPADADFSTNRLLFALNGPVNVWFSTNTPPSINTPGDVDLLPGTTNGFSVLSTGSVPTNIVPGSVYYLGVQNLNDFSVTYGIEVDFHLIAPFAFTQPAQAVTGTSALLNGMATPNGLPATAWFEWGTTTNYGNKTLPVYVGNSYNVVYTNSLITGLTMNVPYHFRLVVNNGAATTYGFDQLLDEANVVIWGANAKGQAVVPPELSNVVAIAGAYGHSLALRNNGTAVGWGENALGQATVPANLTNLLAIAGGEFYSMVLRNDDTVVEWGDQRTPAGLSNIVEIAGGTFARLALKNDGSVLAWGADFSRLTDVPPGFSNAVAVAGGLYHSLAIKNDGTVVAWGNNSVGQLDVPAGLTNVVGIAGGAYHSLALKYNGTVAAWGDDSAGQTEVPAGLSNVVAVTAGGFNCMALKSDGQIVTWGTNDAGQCSVPVSLTNAVAISSGFAHSLALTPQSNASLTSPAVLNITDGVAQTNTVVPGDITYYQVNVPADADFSTNRLLFALNGPVNVWFSTNTPPSISTPEDVDLLPGATNGFSILSTNTAPTNIVPGSVYYLGVQNLNDFSVTYGIEVDFHLVIGTNTLPQTNTVPISGIIYTNISGTNGYLLTWWAPTNDLFRVQMTDGLPPVWQSFSNVVAYTGGPVTATNGQFSYFDDGSQYPFNGPRFYRLILEGVTAPASPAPELPVQPTRVADVFNELVVTNTATDAAVPMPALTYTLTSTVTGANVPVINPTNGVITWTPDPTQAGTSNELTTIVTAGGVPALSATNEFAVIVNPLPGISSVTATNISGTNGYLLTWWAPTNDLFRVQMTDGLPPVWQSFSNVVAYTGGPVTATNGQFSYFDDGSQYPFNGPRFYRLILEGVTAPASPAPELPVQPTRVADVFNELVVTNTATDAAVPMPALTYTLTSTVTGANVPVINPTNGVITWTPDPTQAGTSNELTTIVTAGGVPALSATNEFAVIVNPLPGISSVTATNISGTNGYLLTWWAPTNDLFRVQMTDGLPPVWQSFSNVVAYTGGPVTATNGQFSYFDDGSQYPFNGPRFYRLILEGVTAPASPAPELPVQPTRVADVFNELVVTNTATDAAVPMPALTYTLTSTVTGANVPVINPTNGVITWTPDPTQAGTSNELTTIVTAGGVPALSATNEFAVIVNPLPGISSVTATNISGTNGYLLTWWAPTNDLFRVQMTDGLPPVWQSFSNVVAYTGGPVTATNGQFSYFDDGSQYPFNGPRFYRLILEGVTAPASPAPELPVQPTRVADVFNELVVTNTATDAAVPMPALTYTLTSTVTGANVPVINPTNGVITWTPDPTQAGTSNELTTIVTAGGVPALSATNEFAVIVNPLPGISSVTATNISGTNGYLLTWWAPTNDLFRVQMTDGLPPVWQSFSNVVAYTGGPVTATNGQFSYFDDGSQYPFNGPRFYRLILEGVTAPASPAPATNTIHFSGSLTTNGGFQLTWSAPTNDQFRVQWTTNLVPPFTWNLFPGTNTSTSGLFSFTDTNAPFLLKFYELILLR